MRAESVCVCLSECVRGCGERTRRAVAAAVCKKRDEGKVPTGATVFGDPDQDRMRLQTRCGRNTNGRGCKSGGLEARQASEWMGCGSEGGAVGVGGQADKQGASKSRLTIFCDATGAWSSL